MPDHATSSTATDCRNTSWFGLPAWLWLSIGCLVAAVQIISAHWYSTPDACAYLSIARSLTGGEGPRNLGDRHLTYGAGYPFLISPVFRAGPFPFLALSLIHAAFASLYVVGVYFWVKPRLPEAAVPIALLAVVNVIVLAILRRALSEALFLPLMIWLVNSLEALDRPGTGWRRVILPALLLGVLAVVRQAGILFAVGFGLLMAARAFRGQVSWKRACGLTAAVGVPACIFMSAMVAYDQTLAAHEQAWSNLDIGVHAGGSPNEYGVTGVFAQCLEGVRVRVSEVGRLMLPGMFNAYGTTRNWLNINLLVYIPWFVLIAVGWWHLLRRQADVFALTLPFYAALYVYWPFNQSGRFFAPLLPLLYLCMWHALGRLAVRRQAILGTLLAAHLGVAVGYWLCMDRPRALADARCWPAVHDLASRVESEPGTIAVTPKLASTQLMLQYVLDQRVDWLARGQAVDPHTQWLVADGGETVEANGFSTGAIVGPYRLLHRSPAR